MGLYFWVGHAEVGPALAPYKRSWWCRVHPALHANNSGQWGESLKLKLPRVLGLAGRREHSAVQSALFQGWVGNPRGRRGSLSCLRGPWSY